MHICSNIHPGSFLGVARVTEAGPWRWTRAGLRGLQDLRKGCSKLAAVHLKPGASRGSRALSSQQRPPTGATSPLSILTLPMQPETGQVTHQTLPSPSLTKPSFPPGYNGTLSPVSSVASSNPETLSALALLCWRLSHSFDLQSLLDQRGFRTRPLCSPVGIGPL